MGLCFGEEGGVFGFGLLDVFEKGAWEVIFG